MPPRQPKAPSIRLENITVMRGNRMVLRGFSLLAEPGDIVWIRGANGCGKSTLLRLVAGLLTECAGTLYRDGDIALCDENLALDDNLQLKHALAFWAGLDRARENRKESALFNMDLANLADIPVRYLSTGQRKRANIARVIASDASIWLLDEPYNGLDSANIARLDAALRAHSEDGGIAFVAAHHDPSIDVKQNITLGAQHAEAFV